MLPDVVVEEGGRSQRPLCGSDPRVAALYPHGCVA